MFECKGKTFDHVLRFSVISSSLICNTTSFPGNVFLERVKLLLFPTSHFWLHIGSMSCDLAFVLGFVEFWSKFAAEGQGQ